MCNKEKVWQAMLVDNGVGAGLADAPEAIQKVYRPLADAIPVFLHYLLDHKLTRATLAHARALAIKHLDETDFAGITAKAFEDAGIGGLPSVEELRESAKDAPTLPQGAMTEEVALVQKYLLAIVQAGFDPTTMTIRDLAEHCPGTICSIN